MKGLKVALVIMRAGLGQLDEADHRGQRRALDHLHQEADRRRHRDAQRLRQDHVAQLLAEAERQAADASHWPLGIDATQPRQISVRKALV